MPIKQIWIWEWDWVYSMSKLTGDFHHPFFFFFLFYINSTWPLKRVTLKLSSFLAGKHAVPDVCQLKHLHYSKHLMQDIQQVGSPPQLPILAQRNSWIDKHLRTWACVCMPVRGEVYVFLCVAVCVYDGISMGGMQKGTPGHFEALCTH